MPLGLTWLDVLLSVALAMLLVQGHRRGLWVVLGNLVGLVGGATKTHPLARLSLKIMDVKSAQELGEIAVAVGLAQAANQLGAGSDVAPLVGAAHLQGAAQLLV